MYGKLQELRARKEEREGGFTLIELLVVVVIIGILVAIAIPLYLKYTQGANKRSGEADVRNAVSAVQQGYADNNNVFPFGVVNGTTAADGAAATCANTGATPCTKITLGTTSDVINVSTGNTVAYTVYIAGVAGTHPAGTFTIVSTDANGVQHSYDSQNGGSVS